MTKTLDDLLHYDPLAEAEKATGVSYKDESQGKGLDNPAAALAFLLLQENSLARREILEELDDTVFDNDLARYQRIIEKYGFEKVLEDDFATKHHGNEKEIYEKYFIYAHRKKGLLLAFDTFTWEGEKPRVNGGNVYYEWTPFVDKWSDCISSGGFIEDKIWAGYHDCREALIHNLTKLDNRGNFIVPWIKSQWLWLLHYEDTHKPNYDYLTITKERISRLPEWVQIMIGEKKNV